MNTAKRAWRPLLAAALLLGILLARPLPARAAVPAADGFSGGGFAIEQVYVNVPEMDVFVRAQGTDGAAISPSLVRAAGVELRLGDTLLDTGNIQLANEAVCYVFLVDNSEMIDASTLRRFQGALRQACNRKKDRDQFMIYTLAGEQGAQCVLPATTDRAAIQQGIARLKRYDGPAADLASTAFGLYNDINEDFQSLAPRKVLLGMTDSLALLSDLTLLAGLSSGATDQLNMDIAFLAACEDPAALAPLSALSSGRVLPCTAEDIARTVIDHINGLTNVLEIKTAIDAGFYGERLETLTLSVPAMGSAVSASTSVYMGHRLTHPAVTKVQVEGREQLTVTFNQPVSAATAALPGAYRIQSEDIWGFRVGVRSVTLSDDGTQALLTTREPLYAGSYSVRLRGVAAALSAVNVSDAGVELPFSIENWPRDRAFYLARLRLPVLVLAAVLLVLAVRAFGRTRRERAAEHAAEVEHLLSGAEQQSAVLRRWLTLFVQPPGAIAESRWSRLVESSLLLGSDPDLCELTVPDSRVAAQHCLLGLEEGGVTVQPLGNARVYVNDQRLEGPYRLQNDDAIKIGRTRLRVVL